jgi:membrane protein
MLRLTFSRWSEHEATRLGASIAFYSLLSLAPLLIFSVGLLSTIFGKQIVESHIVFDWSLIVGRTGGDTVRSLISTSESPNQGKLATAIASFMMLLGASGVFGELRAALNKMWDVPAGVTSFRSLFIQEAVSFALVLGVGGVLLLSLAASAAVTLLGRLLDGKVPIPVVLLESMNFVLSVGVTAILFALIFEFVPGRKLPWRIVRTGAAISALLFAIGKTLLGWYFGWASIGSAYGAAGSLVAVVVWVYYSAQIFLFGAEFTRVWGDAMSC